MNTSFRISILCVLLAWLCCLALPVQTNASDTTNQARMLNGTGVADTIFNWLEALVPAYLVPAGQPTQTLPGGLHFRFYSVPNCYLAIYLGELYYLDDQLAIFHLGTVADLLQLIPSPLNDRWLRSDNLGVEINGPTGVFTSFSFNWQSMANHGFVALGGQKLINIERISDTKWSCDDRWFHMQSGIPHSVSWSIPGTCMITLSPDGQSFLLVSSAVNPQGTLQMTSDTFFRQ